MQSNVPKVSEETKKRWNEEVAQKMQKKLERTSRRDDWAERLEAAAREEGLKEAQQRLYGEASRAHEVQAEEKPKLKAKHKDKEKSKKRKEKKRKRKHESSEAEEAARKSSKKGKQSDPPKRSRAISLDNARTAPEASASPD